MKKLINDKNNIVKSCTRNDGFPDKVSRVENRTYNYQKK